MVEKKAVIIYDGECFYCNFSAEILNKLKWLKTIPWKDEESQEFLRAQFGEVPFSMFLIDREEEKIYAGEKAAKEISERSGVPELASRLIEKSYTKISSIVSLATKREEKIDNKDEVYTMNERSKEHLEKLFSAAGSPKKEEI